MDILTGFDRSVLEGGLIEEAFEAIPDELTGSANLAEDLFDLRGIVATD
jgi:hypothetical protein